MTPFLISFLVTAALTPAVIALARRFGWVASPRADRWHSKPTALMGGIAIFGGAIAGWSAGGELGRLAPLALPAAMMFVLGLVDDRRGLPPHLKLIGQLAAGALLIGQGIVFGSLPAAIAIPLTLLWVVGITNAVNLLDNMDGLAAGVCLLSAVFAAVYCMGDALVVPVLLGLAGACAGFLLYNFNPARIFMGDCGSLFLGFSLAAATVLGTGRSAQNLFFALLVPVALLAVPIFDTTLVAISRIVNGRSVSQGGRDHTSHRLVSLGLSERATVLALYLLTAVFGSLSLLARQRSLLEVAILAMLLFAGIVMFGAFLGLLKVYPAHAVPPRIRTLGGTLLNKREMFQVFIDCLLIPAAFVGAHLLRFEGELPREITRGILTALPFVLVAKLVGLAVCRAYLGIWRFAGMREALRALAGSTVGTVLVVLGLGLATRFVDISRAALIIDWLLFSSLVVAARVGYVALQELFSMLPHKVGAPVLILGAGAEAARLVQRLHDPVSVPTVRVVAVLDEDPALRGRQLHGVPVGTVSDLDGLVGRYKLAGCYLAAPVGSGAEERFRGLCASYRLPLLGEERETPEPARSRQPGPKRERLPAAPEPASPSSA